MAIDVENRVAAQSAGLRAALGAFEYQCLCACAVYPRLRFPLSKLLADTVAATLDQPKPGEDELAALFCLPWFRSGTMPEGLRIKLIGDLDPQLCKPVRRAIEVALHATLTDRTGFPGLRAVPPTRPPWRWRMMLGAHIDAAPPGTIERDQIFSRFMKRRAITPKALRQDRVLRRQIGQWAANLNGTRPTTLLSLGLASVIAAASAALWLRPMLEHTDNISTQVAEMKAVPTPAPTTNIRGSLKADRNAAQLEQIRSQSARLALLEARNQQLMRMLTATTTGSVPVKDMEPRGITAARSELQDRAMAAYQKVQQLTGEAELGLYVDKASFDSASSRYGALLGDLAVVKLRASTLPVDGELATKEKDILANIIQGCSNQVANLAGMHKRYGIQPKAGITQPTQIACEEATRAVQAGAQAN